MTEAIIELVKLVARLAREGLDDDQILERLKDPAEVGADIIARIEKRRKLGQDLLGR